MRENKNECQHQHNLNLNFQLNFVFLTCILQICFAEMTLPDIKNAKTDDVFEEKFSEPENNQYTKPNAKTKKSKPTTKKQYIPRGQPKSGRPWKEPKQK